MNELLRECSILYDTIMKIEGKQKVTNALLIDKSNNSPARSLTMTLLILLCLQANRWTCTNGIHNTRCVGSFVGGSFEKVMLQGIVRCDACFWIEIKHSKY